jgi:hypothetical protein
MRGPAFLLRISGAVVACSIALLVGTEARASCSKPDAPSCASSYGRFDDELSFESCKSDMESYKSDVETYLSCQRRDGQSAIDDYNEAVESFNRRARGY